MSVAAVYDRRYSKKSDDRRGCLRSQILGGHRPPLEFGHLPSRLEREIPRLSKAGWPRHQKNAPVPLTGAAGAVCSTSRSFLIDSRAAHRFHKERFAEIYKEASRQFEPPRLRAFLETLMRAATPPYQGGESALGGDTHVS